MRWKPSEHSGVDPLGLADQPEIAVARQLARVQEAAILAGETDRDAAGGVDCRDELFVDRPGQDHFDNFHRLRVGDPEAVDETALDAEPVEHAVDLRTAAMHDDRVDAELVQQRDVGGEGLTARAHRVPAVFDDDGLPGVARPMRHDSGQHRGDRRGVE